MVWKIPRVWEGGTVIIIGGGPSIVKQFNIPEEVVKKVYQGTSPSIYSEYLKPLHKHHVIAVNMAYKLGDWVDMMFFGDAGFWPKYKADLLNFKGLRVTCNPELEETSKLKIIKRADRNPRLLKKGICTEPNTVCWNSNSGSAAINFAVHLGVKRIILLGFDMTLDGGSNQHWHKFYSGNVKTVEGTFKKHMTGFPDMAADLKKLGIEVINANPESKIEAFPKMNFKDIVL